MRKFVRVGAAVVVAGAMLVGTGGVAAAKAKKVSTTKYAKVLCGTYSGLIEVLTAFAEEVAADTSTDPVAFQAAQVQRTEELIVALTAAETKLRKSYPDIDDGKKIARSLVTNATELKSKISAALDKFRAADPNGVAFSADVTVFTVAIQTSALGLSDPFSSITDQDLISAFGDTKSCKNVVTIIGG